MWKRVALISSLVLMASHVAWSQTASLRERLGHGDDWKAGAAENLEQLELAWSQIPEDQRAGLEFLLTQMSDEDRRSLTAEFLLENCDLAYKAWREAPWHEQVSEELFFNEILPYCCVNELRDPWRRDFVERFAPLVREAKSPAEAAVILNREIFAALGVSFSTERDQAVQSPTQSIASGKATCTGLSILLVDACRAVGVPARLVGVPRWIDNSGNHTWVEIWDGDWRFTGANEPTADHLNEGWFADKAAQADGEEIFYSVYAASFRRTHTGFPRMRPDGPTVYAVNVTEFYTERKYPSPYLVSDPGRDAAPADGTAIDEWTTLLDESTEATGESDAAALLAPEDITDAQDRLWRDHVAALRDTRAAEMESRLVMVDGVEMPFWYQVYGERPPTGRRLFISLHGGGHAAARVNDRQWENQKRLYEPEEGIYLAPRAPTNTWNLWHEAHIDRCLDRLIENLIALEGVDPNRVYLLGYSAGGDGVYQLAPRMADRFAAASMMAGHPNEASPLGLRNLPFAIHMGANDSAYRRNEVAQEWGRRLQALRSADPDGYEHVVQLHEGKGHWMDRQDAEAIAWLSSRSREPYPDRIVWYQDDVTHTRFYWLAVPPGAARAGTTITARRDGQRVFIESKDVEEVIVRFHPAMVDFAQPVTIHFNEVPVFSQSLEPSLAVLEKTLSERGDPQGIFAAEVTVALTARGHQSGD